VADTSNDIFEQIRKEIRAIKWAMGIEREPDLSSDLKKLINQAATIAHREYQRVEGDREALKKAVMAELERERIYTDFRSNLDTYKRRHQCHTDKHRELRKIENAQGRRNVFWRGLSTFVVAGVIFFFYWLAGCLGVQLPLSRLIM
jgi:hypothetical protein